MKKKCIRCGGELREETVNGKKLYTCIYCDSEFDEDELNPASVQTSTPSAAASASATPVATTQADGGAVYEKVKDSVATVVARCQSSGGTSTGFLVSSKGFFLTNAHSVFRSDGQLFDDITVTLEDKTFVAYPVAVGEPLGSAKGKVADLCLLWADGDFSGRHVNTFCDYKEVKNGQTEYIIGNPFGEGMCITAGIVSDKDRPLRGIAHKFLMTDAATNAGNSGGPHYNVNAEVIGVHVAGRNASEGMNYAVPSYVAEAFISEVLLHEKLRDLDFGELNKYREHPTQSTAIVIAGIRLFIDIIEYILKLMKK